MSTKNSCNSAQLAFFDKLKGAVSPSISLANELSDLLEISVDGVYRRMRGESILSMDELMVICRHFKVSPELGSGSNSDLAAFRFQHLFIDAKGIENYLQSILSDLKRINAAPNKQIIYAAGDLPLFLQFIKPEFATFKTLFWQRSMLNTIGMEEVKISMDSLTNELRTLCNEISKAYITIPSIEIWHDDTVLSNIRLIEFAWDSGMFKSKQDALIVCDCLIALLNHAEKQAAKSSKFMEEIKWAENEGNLTMYHSDFILTNNHVLVTAGTHKALYLTHNTFNTMVTSHETFCGETEQWLKNIMQKSVLISGAGEKLRHQFFTQSRSRVEELAKRIV